MRGCGRLPEFCRPREKAEQGIPEILQSDGKIPAGTKCERDPNAKFFLNKTRQSFQSQKIKKNHLLIIIYSK